MCWRDIRVLLPKGAADTVVYLPGDHAAAQSVAARLTRPAAVASIPVDWNRDLSPWPAQRVSRGGEDFAGGAGEFLAHLQAVIIPQTEAALPFPVRRRCIAGYSLAGLFALWAAMETELFHGAASMSGSLWFDGFMDWAGERSCHARRVYLSVGDREARTRNPRMAPVEACTRELAARLASAQIDTTFVLEKGGHFDEPDARVARGIDWLLE